MIISKITHELIWSNIFYFKLKSLLDHGLRVEKKQRKNNELASLFKYA